MRHCGSPNWRNMPYIWPEIWPIRHYSKECTYFISISYLGSWTKGRIVSCKFTDQVLSFSNRSNRWCSRNYESSHLTFLFSLGINVSPCSLIQPGGSVRWLTNRYQHNISTRFWVLDDDLIARAEGQQIPLHRHKPIYANHSMQGSFFNSPTYPTQEKKEEKPIKDTI